MDKKSSSKPMKEMMSRLSPEIFDIGKEYIYCSSLIRTFRNRVMIVTTPESNDEDEENDNDDDHDDDDDKDDD